MTAATGDERVGRFGFVVIVVAGLVGVVAAAGVVVVVFLVPVVCVFP